MTDFAVIGASGPNLLVSDRAAVVTGPVSPSTAISSLCQLSKGLPGLAQTYPG
jgi:hypothetical protein